MKYLTLLSGVLVLLLLLTGCAKPPDAEREAARVSMDAAVSAGADKYAPVDFDGAQKMWDSAESRMKEKKYKEAKQAYIDVKAAFEKSAAAAEAGKKAAADQANASLSTLEESWKNLQATARTVRKKLRDREEAWTADSGEISEGLSKAREMIPADPAGAKTKLDEVKGVIDRWEAAFKKMASTPKKPETTKKKTTKKKETKKKGGKKKEATKKAAKNKAVDKTKTQPRHP